MSTPKSPGNLKSSWTSQKTGLLVLSIAAFALGSYLYTPLTGFSFFRQLTIGRWIEANGAVPFSDLWTQAGRDRVWYNSSWLWDLFCAFFEKIPLDNPFFLLKFSLAIAVALSLSHCFGKFCRSLFFGFVIAVPVASGILYRAPLDSSLLAYSLVASILTLLYPWFQGERGGWSQCFLILFLSFLISNSYPGQLMVLLLVSSYLVTGNGESGKIAPVLCLLSPVFLSPYLGAQAFQDTSSYASLFIDRLTLARNSGTLFHFETCFLLLIWALILVSVQGRKTGTRVPYPGLTTLSLLLSIGALADLSLSPWALIFSGFTLSVYWGAGEGTESNFRLFVEKMRNSLAAVDPGPAAFLFLSIVFLNFRQSAYLPVGKDYRPLGKDIEQAIKESGQNDILHARDMGDYLVYLLSDEKGSISRKPHFDSRLEVFSREASRRELMAESMLDGGESLFSWVEPELVICRPTSLLCKRFLHDSSWVEDDSSNSDSNTRFWTIIRPAGVAVQQ